MELDANPGFSRDLVLRLSLHSVFAGVYPVLTE